MNKIKTALLNWRPQVSDTTVATLWIIGITFFIAAVISVGLHALHKLQRVNAPSTSYYYTGDGV